MSESTSGSQPRVDAGLEPAAPTAPLPGADSVPVTVEAPPSPTERPQEGQWFEYPDAEIVLGLVASVGTDLDAFYATLEGVLRQFKYTAHPVRLSEFLKKLNLEKLGVTLELEPEYRRLLSHMRGGTEIRRATYNDILALHAVWSISESRPEEPLRPRTAYVLRTLKHPDEVHTLRRVYGPGFYLIGIYEPHEDRKRHLLNRNMSESEAQHAMDTDEDERVTYGQRTRDTFELADVFVTVGDAERQLGRIFNLIFGNPFLTPTPDEHAMFMAYAASVRSGSLSRQVGAAVVTPHGEILATGANDTPAPFGGLYWPGEHDHRDWCWLEVDSNDQEKDKLVIAIMKALGRQGADAELLTEGRKALSRTGLLGLTEYGRDVHAEMDALLTCARLGVSPRRCTVYCTTFPCHNCAKHLVAAGIRRLVYVEPYPKSKALDLHSDAISTDPDMREQRVVFEPFVGVGPRRYFDLFSTMGISTGFRVERKKDGRAVKWTKGSAAVRVPMRPISYLDREQLAADDLEAIIDWYEEHGEPHDT